MVSTSWEAHASHFQLSANKKNKSYDWVCKYCGKHASSGLTRFEEHLAKVGGNIVACPNVPKEVSDEIYHRIQVNPRRKRNFIDVTDNAASVPPATNASPAASASASASAPSRPSPSPSVSVSANPNSANVPNHGKRAVKQTTLKESSGGTIHLKSHIQKLQDEAEGEIARTIIECNLSFHVLKVQQWKKMVVAISKVGYVEGWTGLSYNDMRGKRLMEEKQRIDTCLDPVRAGWAKYGCSILSDGWSDRKKRGLINILVSSPLGTYFLRAVDSAKMGRRTSVEYLYKHIREAVLEVIF